MGNCYAGLGEKNKLDRIIFNLVQLIFLLIFAFSCLYRKAVELADALGYDIVWQKGGR